MASKSLKSGKTKRITRKKAKDNVIGLSFERNFSTEGVHPFDEIQWEIRSTSITDEKGNVIFSQDNVEVPSAWSQLATNIVVSKYFYGELNTDEREYSIKQLVERVARTITDKGIARNYFVDKKSADIFYQDLCYLLVNQYGAFNSPVWFNVGLYQEYGVEGKGGQYYWDDKKQAITKSQNSYEYPQGSACFIQSVEDNMESIMSLAHSEAMLFKYGSGTGTDLSTIRSSREKLSGGGTPSGPLSFMRVFDQVASVVKSGGKTRRAAKMQSLMDWHPDIREFINCKRNEEAKAWALIEQGYDGNFNGDAYGTVLYQNANLSVRLSDEFMNAAVDGGSWYTKAVTTGDVVEEHNAKDMLRDIAEGTRICGDPGLQYHSTINSWHTCPVTGPINASNPCSEYMFLNDTSCNLASLNLMKFRREDSSFDVDRFKFAIRTFLVAQEIMVDGASYPSELIAKNSHDFRPLGLGYANLGSLVMAKGLPYDSDEGRSYAAAITAVMGGEAYKVSSEMSEKHGGPFVGYPANRRPMMNVMRKHRIAVNDIDSTTVSRDLMTAARESWDSAIRNGELYGFRNSQVTVLAPTGTIGFLMDCDTTGIEPDIALVKYKLLAGGGMLKIVNRTVPEALEHLGYNQDQIGHVVDYIEENDTIEGAPELKEEHLPVFDCAFRAANGSRAIYHMAHLQMMGAVQPFLSGAISKTVNMPKESTTEEIMNTYIEGWKMGLKAVAIYRDGSKRSQPLNTSLASDDETSEGTDLGGPKRRRMSDTRNSITHKFEIAGHEGYMTVGLYEDGHPGELFITMAKEGSTVGGLMDAFGTMLSLSLQYGVPLQSLVEKFAHSRFEPSGFTKNPDIPIAKSIIDYIFRWLGNTFIEGYLPPKDTDTDTDSDVANAVEDAPTSNVEDTNKQGSGKRNKTTAVIKISDQFKHFQEDAPACDVCGSITVRNANCYKCFNCGNSLGCS